MSIYVRSYEISPVSRLPSPVSRLPSPVTVAALEVSDTELSLSSESEVSGEEGEELGGLSCRLMKLFWVFQVKGFSS